MGWLLAVPVRLENKRDVLLEPKRNQYMSRKVIKSYLLRYSVKDPYFDTRIRSVVIPARTLSSAIETLSVALSEFYKEFTIVY